MVVLSQLAHRFARFCGYDFRRYSKEHWLRPRRAHILQTYDINMVLDVGASTGSYALELRQDGYRGHIMSFEPLSREYAILGRRTASDPLWRCANVAVGDTSTESIINVSKHRTSSSLLPMTSHHITAMPGAAYVDTQSVRVRRLDTLFPDMGPEERIYLKADVQGYEKQVLDGAKGILYHVYVLELELSLTPLYEGATPWFEMLDYAQHLGFSLVSIAPVFSDPETGFLLQVDTIFAKSPISGAQGG